MTKSVCCGYGKMFLIYNLFYINFLQVFSINFFCKPVQSPSGLGLAKISVLGQARACQYSHAWASLGLLFGDHYGNKGHQTLYSVFYPW